MKKKRTTIFRQLIISVLIPVTLLISALSLYNFYDKKKQLEASRIEAINQLQTEIGEFLEFYDITILELEQEMSADARKFSTTLVYDIFGDTKEILSTNLDSIRTVLEMPEGYDIYVIDTNGVIVNTTYSPDLGLDFFARGEYFINHFNEVWRRQEFMEDRISIEGSTRLPKKYTYQSTLDTNYVVELGIYNQPSIKLVEHMVNRLNSMPNRYENIDSVTLYFGTTYFMNYQGHPIRKELIENATKTLETKESTEYIEKVDGTVLTTEYHYLKMESAHLHDGYLLRVQHNDLKLQNLRTSEFKSFLFNLLIFVGPIFLLILWRAKRLSAPISNLVQKIDIIRNERALEQRVPITGNNEVTELGEHFNEMVDELQESYATLEQKVEDRTREVVQQKVIIEEVHEEIQASIKYAKGLQTAILPSLNDISDNLPNSFVLFKPKDIVSGDFYWFEKHNDDIYLAAADCTGHGVPGAMVSVVCSNALHQALFEFGCTEVDQLLNKTRDLVVNTFAKSGESVRDGMDIALIKLNPESLKLEYAGANNALYLLKNGNEEMDEFKADKQPVGLYTEMKPFTSHTIQLGKGDTIYLFSDGYADQFGGERGKKFKYKPFKRLLIETNILSPKHQEEELIKFFENWRQDYEQVDDVCVIGVRV
ncbi:MAG: SpoIIE family protein phosphatase [Crocinitomicaceae bacterium]|nr:SpoIIE family protein phosphatase [Crocinitomicaceae bacterium]